MPFNEVSARIAHNDTTSSISRSKSICHLIWPTTLHRWYDSCIPFEPWHQRLDDLESSREKRQVMKPEDKLTHRYQSDKLLPAQTVPLLGLLISTVAWWITLSSEQLRQSSLMRWPILAAFTIGESIAVGFISSVYAYDAVIKAMIATAAATLSVTFYTLIQRNPKYDLSQW